MNTISIQYRFTYPDGSHEFFDLHLDATCLELLVEKPATLPDWTTLTFHQCPNCPLDADEHPYCPLAANIIEIVTRFNHLLSCDMIHLDVITPERMISQKTSAQRGVSSLMGLVIANSGCPHTSFFKSMARFHLPLANIEETIYRAASMYFLAQYFLKKEGETPDFELQGLKQIYENIHIVNQYMAKRIRAASDSDVSANAVTLLDVYAMTFPYAVEDTLKKIRYLFNAFFEYHLTTRG